MSDKAFTFMAFGKAQVSTDSTSISRYVGVGSVTVEAVNPTKKELEVLYNTTLDRDIEYVGKTTINDKEVPQVRIDFIVKTDPERNNGIAMTTKVAFFVARSPRVNKDVTKIQVIDKYGNTAWCTNEQFQNREIPIYSSGPANIDKDYRACYIGEEDLINFIKNYLNIPSVIKFVNNKATMIPSADCECRLDHIEDYFKGDFSELKEAIALQPNNHVKVLFGVKTSTDNNGSTKQYQSFYSQMTLRNNISDYSKLDKEVRERKAAGSYPTTEFFIGDLKEYVVEPTKFSPMPSINDTDPFGIGSITPTGVINPMNPWD